jgi:hypothetical protein
MYVGSLQSLNEGIEKAKGPKTIDTEMETGEKEFPSQAVRVCMHMFICILPIYIQMYTHVYV